jgi:hypothetical protein
MILLRACGHRAARGGSGAGILAGCRRWEGPAVIREVAEVNRHGALGGAKRRQSGEKGAHLCSLSRHDRFSRASRLGGVPRQCKNEAAHAPCRAILGTKLRIDRRESLVPLAADGKRQGQPSADFGIFGTPQGESVVGLGPTGIATEIMREAPVTSELRLRNTERNCILEEFEGR